MSKSIPSEPQAAERKQKSTGQLLLRCARLLNEEALARIRTQAGAPRLRASHAALLPHLDLEGTRLTDLATRMGVTKQAVGQLVEELEGMGVLTRTTDADDRRAKRVRFATRGKRGLLQGQGPLGQIEDELNEALGSRPMQALHVILTQLLGELESRRSSQSRPTSGGRRERKPRGRPRT